MRRRRAVRLIAVLSIGLIAASFVPGPAGAQQDEEFVRGSGSAYAQIYRVGPTAGRLSLAPIFGLSLADYLNTVGRGETKVADWAGIGVAEESLPDNTPSLKVASTQEGAEKGQTKFAGFPADDPQIVLGQSDGSSGGGFGQMYVRATDAPLGESRFRLSTLSIPGLIEARDSLSHTVTGIVSDGLREATATTEIESLNIAGGAVVLKGLRWVAVQRTGAKETVSGSFTIEGATIGGVPLPVPQGSDLAAVIGPINTALAPTGFAISLPQFEKAGGQANVTPLSLDIVNSPLGRQFLAPILEALHPAREPVTDLYIQLAKDLKARFDKQAKQFDDPNDDEPAQTAPDLTVGVLAADLAVGIFSGSSQLHMEFGGVRAFTEGKLFENPFGAPAIRPLVVTPPQTIVAPGTPGTPPIPGTPGSEGDTELVAQPLVPRRTVPGDKGGLAVAVGLIGLAVAMGLAFADWHRMRKSRAMQLEGAGGA